MLLEISSSGKDPKGGTYKNIKMKHFSLEQVLHRRRNSGPNGIEIDEGY